MVRCVVVRCPICERRTHIPADRASTDVFADRIAAHVHSTHPEIPPRESEAAIEEAVDTVEVVEEEVDPDDVEGWSGGGSSET